MKKGATHFRTEPERRHRSTVRDEFIVYDKETNHAHCLNSTAADVWKLCDGERSLSEIIHTMEKAKSPIDERLAWMALRKLNKAGLLLEPVPSPPKA